MGSAAFLSTRTACSCDADEMSTPPTCRAVQCSQYSSYVDSSVGVGDMQMVEVREAVEAQRGAAHNEAGARVAAAAGGAGVR